MTHKTTTRNAIAVKTQTSIKWSLSFPPSTTHDAYTYDSYAKKRQCIPILRENEILILMIQDTSKVTAVSNQPLHPKEIWKIGCIDLLFWPRH
jgi:hypothetical protein